MGDMDGITSEFRYDWGVALGWSLWFAGALTLAGGRTPPTNATVRAAMVDMVCRHWVMFGPVPMLVLRGSEDAIAKVWERVGVRVGSFP